MNEIRMRGGDSLFNIDLELRVSKGFKRGVWYMKWDRMGNLFGKLRV